MSKLIIIEIPVPTIDSARSNVQSFVGSMEPYKVNLTEEQKGSGRKMAEGREGYARLVSQVANNHANSLLREHNPSDLIARLAYDSKLEELRQPLMKLLEIVSETQVANGIDAMKLVDDYVKALQISRNSNGSLDLAMREIDEWNKRFANIRQALFGAGRSRHTAISS